MTEKVSAQMLPHHPRWSEPLVRVIDIVIALIVLGIAALPMLLIALAIKLEDRGSVIFFQARVGKHAKVFHIWKFRTMTEDQSRVSGDLVSGTSAAQARAQFQTTSKNDSRITRVGRILRPVHLDELPQIVNVLKGDMSFVGVRPDVPVQIADYTEQNWQRRHVFRPGITGLAQVAKDVDSTEKRTAYDLKWVDTYSLGLYMRILLATFGKILRRNSL